MATITDLNKPSFVLFPVNNNRTAWVPFGLPVILVVPNKRDPVGSPNENAMIFSVRIYIENVPQSAFVAGHDHVGLRFPDRELYAETLDAIELADRLIDLVNVTITRDGEIIEQSEAKTGDLLHYTTSTGIVDTITYITGADYYDLSDIQLEVETLPSDNYNIVYEGQYFTRLISKDDKKQFLCIDTNSTSLALLKFQIQHPGQVLEEFYRHTPPPYLTNEVKSKDTTVALYRPFTDILQDIMDEQGLLERINWVFDAPAEAIPYLSSLLGWDLPYFPLSLDQLRRAVLRRTVEFQNLKGSRRSIVNIFKLFGFEILISNLWWSSDGKRFIRPGETLPPPYEDEIIDVDGVFQIDLCLSDQLVTTFGDYSIPLLYRPQIKVGLDDFTALQDGGDVTIDAYVVQNGSPAWEILNDIATTIQDDPGAYGQNAGCVVDDNGFINPTAIHDALASAEIVGYSQILISGKLGKATDEILAGIHPPVTKESVQLDRENNKLNVVLNGYFNPNDDERVFLFTTYQRLDIIVPDALTNLQSNRFDLQILTKTLDEYADPVTLEFAIEFLYRLKAFHSLLNVIRTRIDLTETYEVTDLCIGGDIEQRYNTDIGRLQVPPAIIPNIPGNIDDCTALDPESLGYKESDINLRLRKLANMPEEHAAWALLDDRVEDDNPALRLQTPIGAPGRDQCKFTYRGQDRIAVQSRVEKQGSEYSPSPNVNQLASGYTNSPEISPNDASTSGSFDETGITTSTNSDSQHYGLFSREYTDYRVPSCELDGVTDYCYKGRVDDEVLYRTTLLQKEQFSIKPCNLGVGLGVYWAFPILSQVATPGTIAPCRTSKTQKIQFSGKSPESGIVYYSQGKQEQFLVVSYNTALPKVNDSLLGRLYRDYKPFTETLHYTNRNGEPSLNQQTFLALQRPSLEVQKPTLHLPGCRFPLLNRLENDFMHATWKAKPWDSQYSTSCGLKHICGTAEPTYLNFTMVTDSDGNETLVYDNTPYKILGNGIVPDIATFGNHILGAVGYVTSDVIHKVYMKDANSNPAVSFDQVCPFDSDVDGDGIIQTSNPIFPSYFTCADGISQDYADGYPCLAGFQALTLTASYFHRSGLYLDLFTALGIPGVTDNSRQWLYMAASGIRVENASRFDCGCSVAFCNTVTGTESDTDLATLCTAGLFLNEDDEYDWDPDHLVTTTIIAADESIEASTALCDGSILSFLETI